LFIANARQDRSLPVYGKGDNVRDWIHVADHCRGIESVMRRGRVGQVYNFGGDQEITNIDLTEMLLDLLGKPRSLIQFVADRPGHDQRYAIDFSKATDELDWSPQVTFREGLQQTIDWYLAHSEWLERVSSGAYREYYQQQYGDRLHAP
ncbi:MAG: GDP-mannose 4,6-dehydratase, partial [Planctomycetaceae bacterium]